MTQEEKVTDQVLRYHNGTWQPAGAIYDRVQEVDRRFGIYLVKEALKRLVDKGDPRYEHRSESDGGSAEYRFYDPDKPVRL